MSAHNHPAPCAAFTPGPWTAIDRGAGARTTIVGADWPGMGRVAEVNMHRSDIDQVPDWQANRDLIAAAPDLYNVLRYMNHMGGDERGGYCICPCKDGSAPDSAHASVCVDARAALAKASGA